MPSREKGVRSVMAVVGSSALLLAAPAAAQQQATQPPAQQLQPALVVAASQLDNTPSYYYGRMVSVHAAVDRVFGARSFTIDEPGPRGWFTENDVLVLMPQTSGAATLSGDEYVTVVGAVRPLVRAELERDYEWFDWNELELTAELEQIPVIVARTVRTSAGAELVQGPSRDFLLVTSAGRIAQLPGRFRDKHVLVTAEVESVWGNRAFTLDEEELFAWPDVLVINPQPTGAPQDGAIVTVAGTVRPFVIADLERDYDWFSATDYAGLDVDNWERRPAIIAHAIRSDQNAELVGDFQGRMAGLTDLTATPLEQRARITPGVQQDTAAAGRQPAGTAMEAEPAQDPAQPGMAGTAGRAGEGDIRDMSGLATANRTELVGRSVNLTNVPVQRVVNDRVLWIGSGTGEPILVMIAEPGARVSYSAGTSLNLSGSVMELPQDIASWNVPAGAEADIRQADVFIHATHVGEAP